MMCQKYIRCWRDHNIFGACLWKLLERVKRPEFNRAYQKLSKILSFLREEESKKQEVSKTHSIEMKIHFIRAFKRSYQLKALSNKIKMKMAERKAI